MVRTIGIALCLVAVHTAQGQLSPKPISATSPRAKRVGGVANLVLGGDRAKLAAYVKKNGADTLTKRADLDKYLDSLIAEAKTGDRTIAEYDSLSPTTFAAALAAAKDKAPTRAILIRTEDKAPYRIKVLRLVRVGTGRGDG